jgi:hypothetical protein
MKTLLGIYVCCVLFTQPLFAQEEPETLVDGGIESGGFGSAGAKITVLNNRASVMSGAWGAWLINHRLALGAGFYNLTSAHTLQDDISMDMEYSGFIAEYIFMPASLVHYSAQLTIGGGSLDFSKVRVGSTGNNEIVDDVFFLVEPGMNVEINVVTFMRFQVGASYRFVSGIDNNNFGVTNADISGPSLNFGVKFGKF